MDQTQMIEAAMDLIGTRAASGSAATDDPFKLTPGQIEKLHRILRDQSKSLPALSSKPLNWTGSRSSSQHDLSANESQTDLNNTTFGRVTLLDDSRLNVSTASSNAAEDVTDPSPQPQAKRKFFKSRTPSTSNSYTVMKGVCATMKRGAGGVQLLPTTDSKKPKRDEASSCKCFKFVMSYLLITLTITITIIVRRTI